MDRKEFKESLLGAGAAQVDYFESIGSTNDVAKEWLKGDKKGIYAAFAEEQKAGRGRHEREWQSPKGASISLSLAIPQGQLKGEVGQLLAGVAGIASCRAIEEECQLDLQLKWPNDLLLEGKKVGGILIEGEWSGDQAKGSVIGIGINVREESLEQARDFLFPATFLEEASPNVVDPVRVAAGIAIELIHLIKNARSEEILREWNERLAFREHIVRFESLTHEAIEGRVKRVDRKGQLVVEDEKGQEKRFVAGEIRALPGKAE